MPPRPAAVAFDVLETVFTLEPLRARLTALGLPAYVLELWFARTLRDGFALAAAGAYEPMQAVARGTLEALAAEHERPLTATEASGVLDALAELPAHPDAEPAFARLHDAGLPVLALSNGSQASTHELLKQAKLNRFVTTVVSIDDVKAWKPRPEVYHYTAKQAGVAPAQLALVAAHAWDCLGAKQAGLTTGWVRRTEPCFNPALGQPDVREGTLFRVVEALLQLPD